MITWYLGMLVHAVEVGVAGTITAILVFAGLIALRFIVFLITGR